MKKLTRDTMPPEVATEMLCVANARRTNRERKMMADARLTVWVSEATRKPIAERLANKMKARPIKWLSRERDRAMRQRRGVQRKYESLMALQPNPVIERFISALNLRAAHLDVAMDAINDEIRARLNLTRGVWSEGVLGSPLCRNTRSWVSGNSYVFRRTEFPRWIPTCYLLGPE